MSPLLLGNYFNLLSITYYFNSLFQSISKQFQPLYKIATSFKTLNC